MFRLPGQSAPVLALVLVCASPGFLRAQTDYYNLDAGRPLRIEDALVIERHAIEWQLAPLRLTGARGRRAAFAAEPELAWGALPRTQVELGVPLLAPRGGAIGAAGVEVTALHALNAETSAWPGLALRVGMHLPAGPYGPRSTRSEVAALATRTLSHGRIHANASFHGGSTAGDPEAARWSAGIAADHAFVLQSLLVGVDLLVEDPAQRGLDRRWSAAGGLRFQLDPRSALDLGGGRTLGENGEWFVTAGTALSLGLLHRFGGVR
jgi:hypothetical protein